MGTHFCALPSQSTSSGAGASSGTAASAGVCGSSDGSTGSVDTSDGCDAVGSASCAGAAAGFSPATAASPLAVVVPSAAAGVSRAAGPSSTVAVGGDPQPNTIAAAATSTTIRIAQRRSLCLAGMLIGAPSVPVLVTYCSDDDASPALISEHPRVPFLACEPRNLFTGYSFPLREALVGGEGASLQSLAPVACREDLSKVKRVLQGAAAISSQDRCRGLV